ncbi:MAG: protein kinase, partial [Nannocystaceae bacterium]|nr:protein kinase [Nannocystaceae bacterium]
MVLQDDPTLPRGEAIPNTVAPDSNESRLWMDNLRAGVKARLFEAAGENAGPDDAAPERPSAQRPTRIGRYVVIKRIGAGGMGVVYAAYDDKLARKVAVKLLRPRYGPVPRTARQRLLREAQAIARLSHRSVIQVYEVGTHDDEVFVAMEYVEGSTLKQWQPSRGWREILARYLDAGRGLCAAHAAGIVHRDFKAENVLIRARDLAVRVVDFGLARTDGQAELGADPQPRAPDAETSLTRTGVVMGTPAYMAPEQHLAQPTDPRTDQYAFCSSLFEALYGYRAFSGRRIDELRANVIDGKVEPAPPYAAVPANIHKTLVRGLSVDPAARFPTMEALLAELALPASSGPWRRARWGLGLAALALSGSLLWSNAASDAPSPASLRIRAAFDASRESGAEEKLSRLRVRSIPQRWNDLVLAYAAASGSPTESLAALKVLSMSDTRWLAAARVSAADAMRRGPVFSRYATSTPVRRVVFSPGSNHLAALTQASAVLRWPTPQTRTPQTTTFQTQPIDIALTADGHLQVLLPGGMLATLAPGTSSPRTRRIHDGPLTAIATDGRGQTAVGAEDGTVFVLREQATVVLREHVAAVVTLAFRPTENTLVSGDISGRVSLSYLDRKTHRTMGIDRAIRQLSWLPDGRVVALTASEPAAWNGTTGTGAEAGVLGSVNRLAAAHDAAALVMTSPEGTTMTLEDGTQFPLESLEKVSDLAISRQGRWTAAATRSGVTLWRTGPDEAGARPRGDLRIDLPIDGEVIGVHARGDAIVALTSKGFVLESPAGHEAYPVAEFGIAVRASVASEDQRHIALESPDGALRVVDLDAPFPLVELGITEHSAVGPFEWSADGSMVAKLACPFDTKQCHLAVHPSDGSPPRELGRTHQMPSGLHISPSGNLIAVAYINNVSSWNTDSGERTIFRVPNRMSLLAVAFHPNEGLRIAAADAGSDASELYVGQVGEDGTLHTLFEEDGLRRLFATADGTGVVLETAEGHALLWRLSQDRFVPLPADVLRGPDTPEIHVAPGGRRAWVGQPLATEVAVLDLETGLRRTLPRPAGP